MLPLTNETYRRVLGQSNYNIFNNSNIKAVFVRQSNDSSLADFVFSRNNPYTYLQTITSSPSQFPIDGNLQFNFSVEDPGSGFTTDAANRLDITGTITVNQSNFTADSTTDSFVFLIDSSLNEVVSYVKLNSDVNNQVMNNITEIAWTNEVINTNALYTSSELTLSAGMIDFIKGEIDKDNLKIALIKDTTSSNVLDTYSTILPCSTVQSLSDVGGGNRIEIISTSHNLSGLDFYKFGSSNNFGMCLKCSETTLYSSPDTQGFSPPYRAILYDISTQKPLVLFSENLGIEGQDNIFIKANGTSSTNNILNLKP
jgi:hypothetical protein